MTLSIVYISIALVAGALVAGVLYGCYQCALRYSERRRYAALEASKRAVEIHREAEAQARRRERRLRGASSLPLRMASSPKRDLSGKWQSATQRRRRATPHVRRCS
jgi:hypothetical protein